MIATSAHVFDFGTLVWGGDQNHFKITEFVWFGKVGWGAGHWKSLQNQSICMVLECWLEGGSPKIIAESKHLYGFGKLGWGFGAPKIIFKINAFVLFLKVGCGGGAQEIICKINASVRF